MLDYFSSMVIIFTFKCTINHWPCKEIFAVVFPSVLTQFLRIIVRGVMGLLSRLVRISRYIVAMKYFPLIVGAFRDEICEIYSPMIVGVYSGLNV